MLFSVDHIKTFINVFFNVSNFNVIILLVTVFATLIYLLTYLLMELSPS
jgi:hypothetical protein